MQVMPNTICSPISFFGLLDSYGYISVNMFYCSVNCSKFDVFIYVHVECVVSSLGDITSSLLPTIEYCGCACSMVVLVLTDV
jgi:hypothetical protein